MITTYQIKKDQLTNGYFKAGTGATTILIIGSCRSAPYVNYFNRINIDNRYSIYHIDPFNWNWDIHENRVDYEKVINNLETDERMLNLLKSTNIYIHEYYNQFGMFNSSKDNEKNIYQFGLKPMIDICIPNFNDLFILFQDIYTFDSKIQELVKSDYSNHGELQNETIEAMKEIGERNIEKFLSICKLSSFPEMENVFNRYFRKLRFFWTYNHISMHFSRTIFELMNIKFLNMELTAEFWDAIGEEDLFKDPHTGITKYDVDAYGLEWDEPIIEFKL